jgi:hypothetical protein
MRLLEKQTLDNDGTVVVAEERIIAHLVQLVGYAMRIGRGHVDIAFPIRASHALRLTSIDDGRRVTIRKHSRVIVT